jgi:serine protease Do
MRLFPLLASVFLVGCTTFPPPDVPAKPVLAEYLRQVTVSLEMSSGGLCSGVWVGKHVVLTANHCVADLEDGETLVVSTVDTPKGGGVRAEVLALDEDHDLALVATLDEPSHPIALAGPMPRVGDRVETMGHPYEMYWSYSSGDVAAIRDDVSDDRPMKVIQATAPISPGNSGGGLFNEKGELVGICSYMIGQRNAQALNFWIPVQYAIDLVF